MTEKQDIKCHHTNSLTSIVTEQIIIYPIIQINKKTLHLTDRHKEVNNLVYIPKHREASSH